MGLSPGLPSGWQGPRSLSRHLLPPGCAPSGTRRKLLYQHTRSLFICFDGLVILLDVNTVTSISIAVILAQYHISTLSCLVYVFCVKCDFHRQHIFRSQKKIQLENPYALTHRFLHTYSYCNFCFYLLTLPLTSLFSFFLLFHLIKIILNIMLSEYWQNHSCPKIQLYYFILP